MNHSLKPSLHLALFTIMGCLSGLQLSGQAVFQKTIGGSTEDMANSVRIMDDCGFLITGSRSETTAWFPQDAHVIRTDSDGNMLWTKTYGGTADDHGQDGEATSDGGFILSGSTNSFGGLIDVLLVKADSVGNEEWTKTIDGNSEYAHQIRQTSDGGYIFCGETDGFGASSRDVYLVKTNSVGDITWSKVIGGSDFDRGWSMEQTSDGGYIIAGETESFGAGAKDVYVIKTDSTGTIEWTKTFGGSLVDYAYSVKQTSDGGYIVAGSTGSFGAGSTDVYLLRLNSAGTLIWSKTYGGSSADSATEVIQTDDGGFLVLGGGSSFGQGINTVYVLRVDAVGDTLWTRSYGGTGLDLGWDVKSTCDGGFIIVGQTQSFGAGLNDVYVIKIDQYGFSGGCNEYSAATIVGNAATVIGSGASVGSGGIMQSDTATVGIPTPVDNLVCGGIGNFPISISVASNNISCYGFNDGVATVTVTGGVQPYTYLWSDSQNQTNSTATGLYSGTYIVTVSDTTGVFYYDTAIISGPPLITGNESYAICQSDSIFLEGAFQNTAGNYRDTLSAADGCDSVVISNLIVDSPSSQSLGLNICDGDSVMLVGNYQTVSGTYTDSLFSTGGCDSVVITLLTVDSVSASSNSMVICSGDSVLLGGSYQTVSGTYYDTLSAANGCDSVVFTSLTVNSVDNTITQSGDTLSASPSGETYQWLNCDSNYSSISGANSQNYTPTSTGNYAVAISLNACSDTSACVNIFIVGISQPGSDSRLVVYPNPSRGSFQISFEYVASGTYQLLLRNILGQQIYMTEFSIGQSHEHYSVEIENLGKGIYLGQIVNPARDILLSTTIIVN